MGLTTRGQLRVLEEVMKVIFALAVIVACVAANGSMPTIAEREVDIIPEDEELIQAKAEEMSLVQADADSRYFKDASEVGGGPSESPGILGMNTRTGAQRTVVLRPRDSPGSPNAEPTEDIVTSERSQRDIANGGDPSPTVDREDSYSPEISKSNTFQSVLNPRFTASEAREGHGVADEIAKIRSKSAQRSVNKLYKI